MTTSPRPPAFVVRHLRIERDGLPILQDLSFEIPAGSRVAIIGPNGAGKTTLLRTLAGLLKASSGEILIDGVPVGTLTPRELALRIAFVPQMTEKTMPCRVGDFVLLSRYAHGRHLFGAADAADREAARQAMQRTGIDRFADRDLSTLSGGERQKVLIAAALAQDTPILLLDEPAAFLDYRRRLELEALLEEVRRDGGRTVVSVVHDLNGGVMETDLTIALSGGGLAFCGTPARLVENDHLTSIFGVSFERLRHDPSGRTLILPMAPLRDKPA